MWNQLSIGKHRLVNLLPPCGNLQAESLTHLVGLQHLQNTFTLLHILLLRAAAHSWHVQTFWSIHCSDSTMTLIHLLVTWLLIGLSSRVGIIGRSASWDSSPSSICTLQFQPREYIISVEVPHYEIWTNQLNTLSDSLYTSIQYLQGCRNSIYGGFNRLLKHQILPFASAICFCLTWYW